MANKNKIINPPRAEDVVIFLNTKKSYHRLKEIIFETTGYESPLIRIATRGGVTTTKTIISVPVQVFNTLAQKKAFGPGELRQYELRDTDLPQDPKLSHLNYFIPLAGHDPQLVRKEIMSTLSRLEARGHLTFGSWKVTFPREGSQKMFVQLSGVSPEKSALIRLFVNDTPYWNQEQIRTIKAYWAFKQEPRPVVTTAETAAD